MSVFARASLQGPPKTSPGHVALHYMPGLPMNLQSLPPQQRPMPLGLKPAPLGLQHQTPHLNLQNLQLSTQPQRPTPPGLKPLMPLP